MIRKVGAHSCVGAMLLVLAACGGGGDAGGGSGSGGAGGGNPGTSGTPQLYGIVNTFFSKQLVGTSSAPQDISLTNSGTAPVIFSGMTVSGPFAAGGNCSGTLQVGAKCTVTLTFTPTVAGDVQGLVYLSSNVPGPPYRVLLDATGFEDAGWVSSQFSPSANYASRCVTPRTGTDPFTLLPYPDQRGRGVDERNWLRSWTNELYLWYGEVRDRDPGLYGTNDAYFALLKTDATMPSGKAKDRFHFSQKTSDWEALSQSGVSAGYGVAFVLLSPVPPRNVVVAYTEPGSQASSAIARGARILSVDSVDLVSANDQGSIDVLNAGLFPSAPGQSHTFSVLDVGASTPRTVTFTSANITSVPVQSVKTVCLGPCGWAGYMLFNDHLATSEAALVDAFVTLKNAGVSDLILDIRYNGGGYLDIASEVAYMIAGSGQTTGRTFEVTQFNDKNPTVNPVTHQTIAPVPFYSTTLGFSLPPGQPLPTLNLARVYVLTGSDTCSASEAIINALRGVDVQVIQIGSTTCGKPYGFYPTDNCGTTYFSVQFKGVNAKGFGDYPNGFSAVNTTGSAGVSLPGCSVADDFSHALGDPFEARLAAALTYRLNGTCPAASGLEPKKALAASGQDGYVPPIGDGRVMKSLWQQNRILGRPPAHP